MNAKKGNTQPKDSITAIVVTKLRMNNVGLIGNNLSELVSVSTCALNVLSMSVPVKHHRR